MVIDLDPPRGFGSIQIGMPIEAAEQALKELPGFVPPAEGEVRNKGFAHYDSELSISLDFDRSGVVRAIELFRPGRDVQVIFRGLSLFEEPADVVISRLSEMVRLEIEEDELNISAPDVFIGLWRRTLPEISGDDDGRYFESVLIAAPGYGA
ncbi:hypothetical protein QFZ82_003302 [Streptomyces sp. V4I23]|uniref:hypothetical protein n=1 Tax=Streptomyces sp. V4I23 TaxID=3042282 RepID=UPI0027889172|nr:hypothetical protein [Streptomyces sp. V4I23]MDQ1008817.1 hypothetical protein [Streptomyces sp. V4I23]